MLIDLEVTIFWKQVWVLLLAIKNNLDYMFYVDMWDDLTLFYS